MDEGKQINFMENALHKYHKNRCLHQSIRPQLLMNSTSINISYILCLNYQEVSNIQYKYLQFWSIDKTHPYIDSRELMGRINISYLTIFKKYFSAYNYKVTFDVFLIFLYSFVFCSTDNLTKILLYSCHIYSTNTIPYNEAIDFLKCFTTTDIRDPLVLKWLTENQNKKEVLVDDIYKLTQMSSFFSFVVGSVKSRLVKDIFGVEFFIEILYRRRIVHELDLNIEGGKKEETSCETIRRLLFTNRKSPYHSDYREILNIQDSHTPSIVNSKSVLYDILRYYDNELVNKNRKYEEFSGSEISLPSFRISGKLNSSATYRTQNTNDTYFIGTKSNSTSNFSKI